MRALLWAMGAGMLVAGGWAIGCSSDETSSGSTTTGGATGETTGGATTGEMTTGGTGSGGSGGEATTSSSNGGTGGSTTSGAGGGYQTCGECTNPEEGAPANECLAQVDACAADDACVDIYNCVYFGAGTPPCESNQAGACCTLDCFASTGAPQAAIDLFEAFDQCVYCDTCVSPMLCDTAEYCAVFEPGGDAVCN